MPDHEMTEQQFKDAVRDRVRSFAGPEPGKKAAFNPAQLEAILGMADAQIQKYYPALSGLLPEKANAVVGLVAGIIHAINLQVNPAPVPAPAPSPDPDPAS